MSIEKLIFSLFCDTPLKLYSIREISLHLGKSYPIIHQHMKKLLASSQFRSIQIGKSLLCLPNYQNNLTLLKLSIEHAQKLSQNTNQEISLIESYFLKEGFDMKTAFIVDNTLVCVANSHSIQSHVVSFLKSVGSNFSLQFFHESDLKNNLSFFAHECTVLHGFESYHLIIRKFYSDIAKDHNVVLQ